jgi:hypothetical protein
MVSERGGAGGQGWPISAGLSIDKPISINYDDERFLKDWEKTLQMNGKENKR